jgi:hypothetical protein
VAPFAGMTQTGSMGLISAAQRAAPQAVIATLPVFAGANKMPRLPRPSACRDAQAALGFTRSCALIAPINTMATPAIDSVNGAPNCSSPMP